MLFIDIKEVEGAFVVIPKRYQDERGFFQEGYNSKTYEGKVATCQQISFSKSKKNVIRGMHCAQYSKLVQCVQGSVFDYMVDLRPESKTYLQWAVVELSADSPKQVYVPPRCGHGIFSQKDDSLLIYCQGGTFDGPREMNVNPFDPKINIKWPELSFGQHYIISDQDSLAPYEEEARKLWNGRNMA